MPSRYSSPRWRLLVGTVADGADRDSAELDLDAALACLGCDPPLLEMAAKRVHRARLSHSELRRDFEQLREGYNRLAAVIARREER